jgi:hypothetical protein
MMDEGTDQVVAARLLDERRGAVDVQALNTLAGEWCLNRAGDDPAPR